MMTAEKLVEMLDGRQYGTEITDDEINLAKNNDLVVVFGASDDLMEFRGAIDDEIDCFDGGKAYVNGYNVYPDNLTDKGEPIGEYFAINAVWCPYNMECDWAYFTSIPHTDFKIYEDDELYCVGIVFDIKDVMRVKNNDK